jgi:hypothetical protein
MLSWPNSRCSVDWKRCDWKLSRPISGTMLIVSDVKWCCHDLIWGDICSGKRYEWKISRPIWVNMWIGTDDKGWCHDLIWGAILIGTDDKDCCHDLIWIATLIQKDVTERFDDQLQWLFDWNSCETMLSWLNLRCYVDLNGSERKFSHQIWGTMWIGTDVKVCCHDEIWGVMWNGTDDKGCCHDSFWGAMWIGTGVKGSFHDQFDLLCGLEQIWLGSVMT